MGACFSRGIISLNQIGYAPMDIDYFNILNDLMANSYLSFLLYNSHPITRMVDLIVNCVFEMRFSVYMLGALNDATEIDFTHNSRDLIVCFKYL